MTYRDHFRKTLLLAVPVCISNLGHILVGIVDAAFVGQIHEHAFHYSATTAQAAVSVANSLYFLVLVFGMGISFGLTPLVAEADSEKNSKKISELLKSGFVVNTLVGIVLFLLLLISSPVLYLFGQEKEVVALAVPFLNVMIFGMIPLMIFSAFKQFAEGLSFTAFAMIVTLGSNLLNILFNWILIFGHWGFPAIGLMGSCWASFISRVVMAGSMFAYVRYAKRFRSYWTEFSLKNVSKKLSKKILSIGIPSGLQWVFEVGAFSFALVMIGWIGSREQASHLIALSIAAATYMIASGLSAAVSVRVGNQVGTKDVGELRKAGFSGFILAVIFMSCFALLFILGKNFLVSFFNKESYVLQTASSLLVIAAFFQLSDGIQVVGLGALRGMKDVKFPTYVTLISYWAIGLPVSYVLGFTFKLGVQGIWYGLLIGLSCVAVFLLLRFNFLSRKI